MGYFRRNWTLKADLMRMFIDCLVRLSNLKVMGMIVPRAQTSLFRKLRNQLHRDGQLYKPMKEIHDALAERKPTGTSQVYNIPSPDEQPFWPQ